MANPGQVIKGGVGRIGRRQKGLHLFKDYLVMKSVGYHTKVVTISKPRKWLFILVKSCGRLGP